MGVWVSLSCLECHSSGQDHAFSSQRDHNGVQVLGLYGDVAGDLSRAWARKPVLPSIEFHWPQLHGVGQGCCSILVRLFVLRIFNSYFKFSFISVYVCVCVCFHEFMCITCM